MISEIFLHVGLHKTATTSLQTTLFLKKNSQLLEQVDYFYPKKWPYNHSIPIFSNFCDSPEKYHVNIKKQYGVQEIKNVNRTYLESLKEEIKKTRCSKLIISGEDISLLSNKNLLNLRNYFLSTYGNQIKFNIFAYVRNPISWSVSAIQEIVKSGRTQQDGLKHVLNQTKNLFQNRIGKFLDVFEKNSVKIYSFEKALNHEFGPVGHFLDLLNLNNDLIPKFHYVKSNESLSWFAVAFLSHVNMKFPLIVNGKLQDNRSKLNINNVLKIGGPKFDIPYSDKVSIYENCENDINWLKNNFGINYSLPNYDKNQKDFELTEELNNELKTLFKNLPTPLQSLLLEYLLQKFNKKF